MKNTENIFEIITNSSFANYMTIKEWEQFESNRQRFSLFPYPIPLSVYLQIPYTSFQDFVFYAFFTMDTPEGLSYWYNIIQRNK